ncbi:MAG: VWA domain-containing protein [Polyangiaceae bacterium]|nr:VWA domain-containing protein [Polyangiaceae bacterium]
MPVALGLASGPNLLDLSWRHPFLLLGLLAVPLVFYRATLGEDRSLARLRLGTIAPLTAGPRGLRVWLRDVPGAVRATAFGLLVTALAGPVDVTVPQTAEEEGIDLVIVVDLSGSMNAVLDNLPPGLEPYIERRSRGYLPTRLDVAKAVIRDFITRRKTDRIGAVVFGKQAYVLSPPTLDYGLLDALVSKLDLSLIDGEATAIGDAVGVAAARLRRSTAESKAVILLTDGDNNAGRLAPEYAAHLANKIGVRVYTVLIGQGDTARVLDHDIFGNPRYVTTRNFPANPELLREIAERTQGEAYVATDAAALQASFHQVLDALEKTKFSAATATYEDLFRFLLIPGVLLLALDALLRALVLRRFP